jgi:hypothetical protein
MAPASVSMSHPIVASLAAVRKLCLVTVQVDMRPFIVI